MKSNLVPLLIKLMEEGATTDNETILEDILPISPSFHIKKKVALDIFQ